MIDNSSQKQSINGLFVEYEEQDRNNQKACIKLIKYCICQIKLEEKDAIFNSEYEEF